MIGVVLDVIEVDGLGVVIPVSADTYYFTDRYAIWADGTIFIRSDAWAQAGGSVGEGDHLLLDGKDGAWINLNLLAKKSGWTSPVFKADGRGGTIVVRVSTGYLRRRN